MQEFMNAQTFWTIAIVVFVVLEVFTLGLTSIWFAVGAVLALIAALLGLNIFVQSALFIIGTGISLYYSRPIALKYFKIGSHKTNVDEMVGKKGLVEKDVLFNQNGLVNIGGQIWSAKADADIRVGERIEVVAVEGVKLKVKKMED